MQRTYASAEKLGVEAAESWTAHCTGVPPVVITAVKSQGVQGARRIKASRPHATSMSGW